MAADQQEWDFSNPQSHFWYAKYKQAVLRNNVNMDMLNRVLCDAKEQRRISYTPRYYAAAKFVRSTTGYRFKKEDTYMYYVYHWSYNDWEDDIDDFYKVPEMSDLACINSHNFKGIYDNRCSGVYASCQFVKNKNKLGKCKNKCCIFLKIPTGFDIHWIRPTL